MPRGVAVMAMVAGALLLVSAAFLGLWQVADRSQDHSYNPGATPPTTFALTAGKQYQLSTVDGPAALAGAGSTSGQLCTWSVDGSDPQRLAVSGLPPDSRSTHVVATFVAPSGGDVHVDCPTFGAVWVDDADDAPADVAGGFLVLAVITLTSGVVLGLTALYRRSAAPAGRHARSDELEPTWSG
jgi:hypothetical protein